MHTDPSSEGCRSVLSVAGGTMRGGIDAFRNSKRRVARNYDHCGCELCRGSLVGSPIDLVAVFAASFLSGVMIKTPSELY